jgi:cyanophycinase-like exopeptidase
MRAMSSLSVRLATPVTTLVLIGGGEFSFGETREIDEWLLSRIPAGRRTIAFLPTASGSAEYATHFGEYVHKIDPAVEVKNVPVYRGRDARRQKNLDAILAAGMIYIGGGVASNLLATIRESAAELAMRDAAAQGAVIAAIGAGASCFGAATRSRPGLGWLEGAAIETGFDPQDDTELRRMMSVPDVTLGLGIPAKTALAVFADGATEIIGAGQVAAFRKQ